MLIRTMEAAVNLPPQIDRTDLLLHHCRAIGGSDEPRLPARTRLEHAIGGELARLLVTALVPAAQGRRGSSSP
jgi:hypothetical protein